jgi:hypothetical protein
MVNGIPVNALTPLAALIFALSFPYLQIARGKLVPQSTLDRMVEEHQRTIEDIQHDRNEWRASHRISEAARQIAADQVEELLEHAKTGV